MSSASSDAPGADGSHADIRCCLARVRDGTEREETNRQEAGRGEQSRDPLQDDTLLGAA